MFSWICQQLRDPHNSSSPKIAVTLLALILADSALRERAWTSGVLPLLKPYIVLSSVNSDGGMQFLYETTLCLWLFTFYPPAAQDMDSLGYLKALLQLASTVNKEKVIRVAMLAVYNVSKLPGSPHTAKLAEYGLASVINRAQRLSVDDVELHYVLDSLGTTACSEQKCNFEKYRRQLFSGSLCWDSVHTDETFWKENVYHFEENNLQLLKLLVTLLEASVEPSTLAIACHDIGKIAEYHPRGRVMLARIGAKDHAIRLLDHADRSVRVESLICMQRLLEDNL